MKKTHTQKKPWEILNQPGNVTILTFTGLLACNIKEKKKSLEKKNLFFWTLTEAVCEKDQTKLLKLKSWDNVQPINDDGLLKVNL